MIWVQGNRPGKKRMLTWIEENEQCCDGATYQVQHVTEVFYKHCKGRRGKR